MNDLDNITSFITGFSSTIMLCGPILVLISLNMANEIFDFADKIYENVPGVRKVAEIIKPIVSKFDTGYSSDPLLPVTAPLSVNVPAPMPSPWLSSTQTTDHIELQLL